MALPNVSPFIYDKIKEIVKVEVGETRKFAARKVLSAKDVGLSVGVGTPFVVRDIETYQPKLLFTGWNDTSGTARAIFVADIDEGLKVRNVKKVADPSLFNVSGLSTVHAFWDDHNGQWVLFTTFYGGTASNVGGVIFTDENFNVVGTQTISFSDNYGAINLADAGISPVPLANMYLFLSAGFANSRLEFYISNFTNRPLPNPSPMYPSTTSGRPTLAPTYFNGNLDVHQLILLDSNIAMLSELTHNRQQWFIQVFYGPEKDWLVTSTPTPWVWVAPIPPPIPIHFTDVIGNIGHPHYTNYLGEPLLFFARFPTWNVGGPRAYAHDIWAVPVDPDELFNPHNKVLVASGVNEPYSFPNLPIPTFGAETAIIILYGVSAAGTLYVYESSSPYHIYSQDSTRYADSYSISAGVNKIVLNNPAPWIGLQSNVSLNEWDVFLIT